MEYPSGLIDFFNDISLSGLEGLAQIKLEDISSKLQLLEETFTNRIEELKLQSVDDITRTHLLSSTDNVEFILRAIIDESLLNTQTEFINHWIAKMILCQKTITMLVTYLIKKCEHYKQHWQKYLKKNTSDVSDERYLFLIVHKTYSQIYGLCQNIGLAISDYFFLYDQIKSKIKEKDFKKPLILDPEIDVSKRLSDLDRETENCLLTNPEKSTLGLAAVRMELESFIAIKLQDKMRQNIRIKDGNSKRDVKYVCKLSRNDIFEMIKDIFPQQKEYAALNMIYDVSSRKLHRAIPTENYVSWGSWAFVLDTLEKEINNLNPTDTRLELTMTKLENKKKLLIVP